MLMYKILLGANYLVAAGFSLRLLKKTQAKACGYQKIRALVCGYRSLFYWSLFCIFLYMSSFSIYASSHNAKLTGLINQIANVKNDLHQKAKQQISVEQQLKNLQIKIKTLEINCAIIAKKLQQQKNILLKLNNNQIKEQAQLQETRNKFSTQMQHAYKIESDNKIKTIFASTKHVNPELILTYHKYICAARLEQMQNIKHTLQVIGENKQKIKQQTKILQGLELGQQKQKQELVKAQQEYSKTLGLLKNKIQTQGQKLVKLIKDKKELEKLIERLNRLSMQSKAGQAPSYTKICKNFVWPTKGIIKVHFGSAIEQSSWSSSGVMVKAPAGQAVRAISAGKVVYADWFNGYGLLLIIDHGNGYMSLYGHNKGFSKKLQDRVDAGEVVAAVGNSDSQETGLYFAIRCNGKPVNPENWCRS